MAYYKKPAERLKSNAFENRSITFDSPHGAKSIYNRNLNKPKPVTKISKENVEDMISLTSLQEHMLDCYRKNINSEEYFVQITYKISSNINLKDFEKAWQFVSANNKILRTVFRWEKLKHPVQIVLKNHKLPVRVIDLSLLDNKYKYLSDIKINDRKENIDLLNAPFRVTLCKLSENEHEIIISNHHSISDGWSNGIIMKEFLNAYKDFVNGNHPVKSIKSSYKEFVQYCKKLNKDGQEQYWKEYLEGYEQRLFMDKYKKNKEKSGIGMNYICSINKELNSEIESFCRDKKITQAALFYSAWGVLLNKYNENSDIVFGTTTSGRKLNINGIENIVGLCMNIIPLRMNFTQYEDVMDILMSVNENLKEREEFENTPYKEIKNSWNIKENRIFDSNIIVENYPLDKELENGENTFNISSYEAFELMDYDITVQIMTFGDMKVKFLYDENLFDLNVIEEMAEQYEYIIKNILQNNIKNIIIIK